MLSCVWQAFSSVLKFNNTFHPSLIRSYEIVSIDNNDYAVIYGSDESKIAVKCTRIVDGNSLKIHYGDYRFIQSEDYEFEYHTFDAVWRDIDE